MKEFAALESSLSLYFFKFYGPFCVFAYSVANQKQIHDWLLNF